jgi:type IV pilus assembly protein PilE
MGPAKKGFTLIELMIVVAIVSILAMIAYPSYNSHVRKTARKEAAGVMLDVAGRMERIRSQALAYQSFAPDSTRRYAITLNVAAGGTGYTITATPSADQASDTCGIITLNHQGAWTFTKNATAVPQSTCL